MVVQVRRALTALTLKSQEDYLHLVAGKCSGEQQKEREDSEKAVVERSRNTQKNRKVGESLECREMKISPSNHPTRVSSVNVDLASVVQFLW